MSEWKLLSDHPIWERPFDKNPPKDVLLFGEFGIQLGQVHNFGNGNIVARAPAFNGDWNVTHWMPLPEPPK